MGRKVHDLKAYSSARKKKQDAHNRRIATARNLLEQVLEKNGGIVAGADEDEVYARLLSDGILGGKSRQIAGAVKQSRHTGSVLSNEDSYRLRSALNVIKAAITAAVNDTETAIYMSFGVKYVAVHMTDYSDLHVDKCDDILGVHDRYDPIQYRHSGRTIKRVGCYFNE